MKKLFIVVMAFILLLAFSPIADARGGGGRGGGGRGGGGRGGGGRSGRGGRGGRGGGSSGGGKTESKIRDLRNTELQRAARISLGREI